MTGRFPIHIARGIQKRFETPRAKTAHETISVNGPKPTRNSIAMSSNPVVIPDFDTHQLGVSLECGVGAYSITIAHEDEEAEIREDGVPDPCWPELSKLIKLTIPSWIFHTNLPLDLQQSPCLKPFWALCLLLLRLRKLFNSRGGKSCQISR